MKIEKMKMLVKRLPNDGLFDLHEVLIDEMNMRKTTGKYIKSVPDTMEEFCETTLPTELKSGINTKNNN